MKWTNKDTGIEYENCIDTRFATKTVAELVSSRAHYLSMKELRKFVNDTLDLPDNTPVLYENIGESLLLRSDSGWSVIPLLWEEQHGQKDYSPAIASWQIFVTQDINGDKAVMLTAHY